MECGVRHYNTVEGGVRHYDVECGVRYYNTVECGVNTVEGGVSGVRLL